MVEKGECIHSLNNIISSCLTIFHRHINTIISKQHYHHLLSFVFNSLVFFCQRKLSLESAVRTRIQLIDQQNQTTGRYSRKLNSAVCSVMHFCLYYFVNVSGVDRTRLGPPCGNLCFSPHTETDWYLYRTEIYCVSVEFCQDVELYVKRIWNRV